MPMLTKLPTLDQLPASPRASAKGVESAVPSRRSAEGKSGGSEPFARELDRKLRGDREAAGSGERGRGEVPAAASASESEDVGRAGESSADEAAEAPPDDVAGEESSREEATEDEPSSRAEGEEAEDEPGARERPDEQTEGEAKEDDPATNAPVAAADAAATNVPEFNAVEVKKPAAGTGVREEAKPESSGGGAARETPVKTQDVPAGTRQASVPAERQGDAEMSKTVGSGQTVDVGELAESAESGGAAAKKAAATAEDERRSADVASSGKPAAVRADRPEPVEGERTTTLRADSKPIGEGPPSGARTLAPVSAVGGEGNAAGDSPDGQPERGMGDRNGAAGERRSGEGQPGGTNNGQSGTASQTNAAGYERTLAGAKLGAASADDASSRSAAPAGSAGASGKGGENEQDARIVAAAKRGLAAAAAQRGGSVTIRLSPESLGQLKVQMELQGASVSVRVDATKLSAQRVLESELGALRTSLEAKGLRVEKLSVQHAPAPVSSAGTSQNGAPGGGQHGGSSQGDPRDADGWRGDNGRDQSRGRHGEGQGGERGTSGGESERGDAFSELNSRLGRAFASVFGER